MIYEYGVLNAVTPTKDLVMITKDWLTFEFWKHENSYLLSKMGVSTELESEAKLYSPLMLQIVRKYELKLGKPAYEFNVIEDTIIRNEFESMYTNVKTNKLDYYDALVHQ